MATEKEQFEEIIKQVMPDRLITNFILIVEIVDADNEELSVNVSSGMTPWLAMGMLRYAENMIKTREDELLDEEDEDDE
jgi:hypothetical protein